MRAVDHDVAAVGELERVEGVLLDQEDGQLLVGVELPDGGENLPRDQRREPERRLVEQQQPRPAHQRARDRQHLLLAAGQRAAALVQALLQPRKQREDPREIGVEMRRLATSRRPSAGFRARSCAGRCGGPPATARSSAARSRGSAARVMSRPANMMVPSRARGLPQIVIISVDLPAPLAPISATISPSPTSTSTPLSAAMLP